MSTLFLKRGRFAAAGCGVLPVLCLILLSVSAGAETIHAGAAALRAAGVTVETAIDRDSVLIADPITYTIEVRAPADLQVEPPPPDEQLGPFDVRDYRILPPGDEGGEPAGKALEESIGRPAERLRLSRFRWTLVPYRTGRLEIPPVAVTVTDTSGISDTLWTGTEPVEVASLEPDLQGDIRDIKPPEELNRGWAWIRWLIGGLVLLAGALYALRMLRRRRLRRGLEEIPYQGPPRPADVVALEELDRIAALRLLEKGMIKEHYIQVSDVIRRYVEGRYAIGAMELTTWELIGRMKRGAVADDHREIFRSLLEECDLVKFAKYVPPAEVRDRLLDRARQLVLTTGIPSPAEPSREAHTPPADARPAEVSGT